VGLLGLALFYGLGAASSAVAAVWGVYPYPGGILTGAPARVVMLALALANAFVARGLYLRKTSAWWSAVALTLVSSGLGLATYATLDPAALLRAQGMTEPAGWGGAPNPFLRGPFVMALVGGGAVAFLGWLLYARRYFRRPDAAPSPLTPAA
jgi:hypothetical protein